MSNTKKLKISRVEYNATGSIKMKINEYIDGSVEEIEFDDNNPKLINYHKFYDENARLTSVLLYNNRKFTKIKFEYSGGLLQFATIIAESQIEGLDSSKIICDYSEKSEISRKFYINGDLVGKEIIKTTELHNWSHLYTNKTFGSFEEYITYNEYGVRHIDLRPVEDYRTEIHEKVDSINIG